MTPQQLKALIESDPAALSAYNEGRHAACAARCSQLAPKVTRETRLRWNRIINLYGGNLTVAASVKAKIDTAAQSSELIGEIADSLRATSQEPCDIGNATVRSLLVAPANAGGIGLTAEEAAPILAAAEVPQVFSTDDVQAAMRS